MTRAAAAEPQSGASPGPLVGLAAVVRHEWRRLVYAPLTIVFVTAFLLATSVAVLLVGDLYATDVASLEPAWTFLPWIALVLVPALAMRAFLDEPGDRALELTMTMPIDPLAIVAGKWLAGSLLLAITLALALAPLAATIAYLGAPDWGVALAGALGATMLLATSLAIALLAAALAREQVGAYVLGFGALLALLLAGWDVVPRLVRGLPGGALVDALALASPKHWLDRMAAGRIELAAIVYFLLASALSLVAATRVLTGRRRSEPTAVGRLACGLVATGVGALVLAIVALAARVPIGLDATAARELTLHRETAAVARGLPAGVEAQLYWSASEASVPQAIRTHARRAREIVGEIARHSGGRLVLTERDPAPDSDSEAEAMAAGLARVPMSSGDSFMLGLVLRHGERRLTIPYLDLRREGQLEYDVALALTNLSRTRPRRVGVLTPLLAPRHASEPREGFAFLEELKRAYDVAVLPHFADTLPADLDAVVVIKAPILKPSMLYALDQHVMSGKGLVVMMDPFLRLDRAQNVAVSEPSPQIDDVSDVLAHYGLTFLGQRVIGDARLAAPVRQSDQQLLAYPYWVKAGPDRIAGTHPVMASLDELLFAEPGEIRLADGRAIALVTTTNESGSLARREIEAGTPETLAATFKVEGGARVLAAAVTAPVESAFATAPQAPWHRARSAGVPAVFAIADADWVLDPFAVQQAEADGKVQSRPINDNIAFLLNMVEAAAGDPRLLAIRGRGHLGRPFTRVAELMRDAQAEHRTREAELAEAIARTEAAISEVLRTSGAKSAAELPSTVRDQIGALQTRLLPVRKELRQLRRAMRERAIGLGRWLTIANLAAGPLLAAAFLALARAMRRRT
jgi:ABC-2 type transport system permease protein